MEQKMKKRNFVILFEQESDGGFSVTVPSLPGCFSQGDTFEEALENIKAAINLYLKDIDRELVDSDSQELIMPVEISVGV